MPEWVVVIRASPQAGAEPRRAKRKKRAKLDAALAAPSSSNVFAPWRSAFGDPAQNFDRKIFRAFGTLFAGSPNRDAAKKAAPGLRMTRMGMELAGSPAIDAHK